MIEVNVHSDIASAQEGQWLAMWGMENAVFSLQTVKDIFANNPNETEFQFNYHCNGGSVSEGFAIYDFIRTSGKTIHSNIEGDCHSMAVTLMLAGAKENRRCNPNASALLHEIRGGNYGTADEMREAADYMDQQTEKMLNIYVDRTGTDRATLENLLKEEKVRTAEELLQYGFISKINPYTTNQMAKKTREELEALQNKAEGIFLGIKNFLTGKTEAPKTFDFKTADGAVLFTVNREDDAIQVDDVASPDGVYNFDDGRVVTVNEGKITSIEAAPEQTEEASVNTEELEELRNQVATLTDLLTQAQTVIAEQKEVITSNYSPAPRVAATKAPKSTENNAKTKEEMKAEVKAKMSTNKNN
jgi:ATP-dependent protease ClpP protease subunit